jgi:hypothetical protein
MRKSILFSLVLGMAAAVSATVALAAEPAAAPAGVKVTIKGTNYNVASTLAKDATADAKPELAAVNALKVAEATGEDGKAIEALKGKTVHYIASKAGEALQTGADNAGKNVTVKGTLFVDANAVLVESFEAAAGGDEWDELDVNSLSGQQVL